MLLFALKFEYNLHCETHKNLENYLYIKTEGVLTNYKKTHMLTFDLI